jgi:hypothetical protein
MVGAEFWGHREHIQNLLGTHWEHVRNKGKMKKTLSPLWKFVDNGVKNLSLHILGSKFPPNQSKLPLGFRH